jgi:predicted  nucleic acid-binding Zn-ribbon protein
MWDHAKRQRYNLLRQREWEGGLTAEEQTELAAMIQEICDLEATYLQPATEQLQQESAQLRAELEHMLERKHRLEGLIRRKEALLARVNAFVTEVEAEQEALQRAYQAMIAERVPK